MSGKFSLACNSVSDPRIFHSGTYIVLFHATRIPPHLLVVHEGRSWDLSVKGNASGVPIETLSAFIERKNVQCLFIEWKTGRNDLSSILNPHFCKYEKIIPGKTTCLFPIRDVAAELHGAEMKNARYIFELLPMLHEANVLGDSFALHIPPDHLTDGAFDLLTYSEEELQASIAEAKKKYTV
ncbi:MAG TPA: hypothetical protein VL651_14385 [Bacteroidia bacterium]|jgi:hypothetical protein|nr:hypothetical protein [Bacteroidia bacterium]